MRVEATGQAAVGGGALRRDIGEPLGHGLSRAQGCADRRGPDEDAIRLRRSMVGHSSVATMESNRFSGEILATEEATPGFQPSIDRTQVQEPGRGCVQKLARR